MVSSYIYAKYSCSGGLMMPKVIIDIREGRSDEHKQKLMDGVHNALVKAIKIPDDDRIQILNEHKKSNFEIPPEKSDLFTTIEIIMFLGRSIDAKRNLYKAIVNNLMEIGIEDKDIMIILHEPSMENWGIRGIPASDLKIGFKIDV
jgi:phenylpyruvate tautomerase PptA (4-oxalocrotonate tautomerase family)